MSYHERPSSPFTMPVSEEVNQIKIDAWAAIIPNEATKATLPDEIMVNHPPHYTSHPSGIECIQITEHMGFNIGNAVKYLWRADLKGNSLQDLEKAIWYIKREIAKRGGK